jgi:hypothetical protein
LGTAGSRTGISGIINRVVVDELKDGSIIWCESALRTPRPEKESHNQKNWD